MLLTIGNYILQSIVITFKLFFGIFSPIVFCCIILNILSKAQNNRLFYIGGWKGLLVTAWIGTPIHEISHYLLAVITNHKILELKLFKPDPNTGSLGYIVHSYKIDNFYQAVIGCSLISIAPFFGGAAVIYLLSAIVFPDFSLFTLDVPQIYYLTLENALDWKSYLLFVKSAIDFFKYLSEILFSHEMLTDWKLYVFMFIMFGIANHLSPSFSDFQNFWNPLFILFITIVLLNLVIYPLIKNPEVIIMTASSYVFIFLPILYFAIFISGIGLIITLILSLFAAVFR